MNPDDVLAHACRGHCIEIWDKGVARSLRPIAYDEGAIADTDLTTWLVRGGRMLTVIKAEGGTRIYDHQEDFLYYASPQAQLGRECPPGHAFLAQTVCDRDRGKQTCTPRILLMDLLHPAEADPAKRGEAMRRLGGSFPPLYHVQWSGNKRCLQAFLSKGMPHEVEAVVALRGQGRLVREPRAASLLQSLRAL